jgi:hypothetical protein
MLTNCYDIRNYLLGLIIYFLFISKNLYLLGYVFFIYTQIYKEYTVIKSNIVTIAKG